jgi:hypothetical protein
MILHQLDCRDDYAPTDLASVERMTSNQNHSLHRASSVGATSLSVVIQVQIRFTTETSSVESKYYGATVFSPTTTLSETLSSTLPAP